MIGTKRWAVKNKIRHKGRCSNFFLRKFCITVNQLGKAKEVIIIIFTRNCGGGALTCFNHKGWPLIFLLYFKETDLLHN